MTTEFADQWRTVQFFLDTTSGHVDEVEWREADGELRCSCDGTEWAKDSGMCLHLLTVSERRRIFGGLPVILEEGAQHEIEDKDLDPTDPAVFRELVLRFGHVEMT